MFNEGEEEQKPDFLQLISEAFRAGPSPNQPSSSKFTPPPNGSNSPLEARVELSMERSLINLPAALRNDLEERFIEILPNYPCFYDPNDKNFAHNQFKSNSYAEIAKKITADGLETSGPQLAAIFKGIKAKYREEARKMTRLEGRIEPSPFYQRLSFLERGLSTVDQRPEPIDKSQLRTVIWYEFKTGRSAKSTAQLINQTYGEGTVTYTTTKRWFQKFRIGDETLQDKRRSGKPKTVSDELLKQHIAIDPSITVKKLAKDLNCSTGSVSKHLKSMGYVKKFEKWV